MSVIAPARVIGLALGHYRILEKIGAGGMGEVYRARDEHLGRDVAIKVLPPGTLADEPARRRFRKEAEALSKLNHPHVATVHDFDTQGEVDFLVMEYVEGVTLGERLAGGPIPERELARLGGQIAGALEEAHEKGVVHRDLKPGNIKVTPKGAVKVLDFGLAKLVQPATESSQALTETQAVAGTLPYMAPEQLRGEPADARTDLWGLGTVLYEMATGVRPFDARASAALAADILTKNPAAPTKLNPQVSPLLEAIILRCLEKDPASRYRSAREVGDELERLTSQAQVSSSPPTRVPKRRSTRHGRPKRIRSLVVLPLSNLSHDPEQEYLADGMTEALILDLARLGALKVISRTSAMRYKATDKSVPEIAEELDVDGVVEGSVARVGQRVRITAQLIRGASDTHLWADSYERDMQDLLFLQKEVAQAIAREIRIAVTPDEARRLASARPLNPEAYEAYVKGRLHWFKLSREHLDTAQNYFQLALQKDPNYALAHAGMAAVWFSRADIGLMPPVEAMPKGKAAALKAIELDETLPEAHEVLGNLKAVYDWDWDGAEREFRRAIELNPNYADAHFMYADFLISMKRSEEAMAEAQRSLELDPLNFGLPCFFGWHLVYLRRYDEAIEQLHKTVAAEPSYPAAHLGLWGAFYHKRMYADALAEARIFFELLGDHELAETLAPGSSAGGYAGAMRNAGERLAARSTRSYVPALRIARLYAHAGENGRALEYLAKAYEQRESPLLHLAVAWDWDGLKEDPRFQDLLGRIRLPGESISTC